MLGKLFKYEFKNTAKLMLTIYAVLAAITALGSIVLYNTIEVDNPGTGLNILVAVLLIFYVLSVFALFIVTYVYMCVHFYKTMYSDQGYLTHTLPVRSLTVFHVKLVTSLVWMLCSMLLMIISVFALMGGASHGEIFIALTQSAWPEMRELFGINVGLFIFYVISSLIFSSLLFLLMVFLSASVGQLFHQYKVVAAVVTGIVLYFIEQIISVCMMFTPGYSKFMSQTLTDTSAAVANSSFSLTPVFSSSLIYSIVICVVYYIACNIIIRKHINLD